MAKDAGGGRWGGLLIMVGGLVLLDGGHFSAEGGVVLAVWTVAFALLAALAGGAALLMKAASGRR